MKKLTINQDGRTSQQAHTILGPTVNHEARPSGRCYSREVSNDRTQMLR